MIADAIRVICLRETRDLVVVLRGLAVARGDVLDGLGHPEAGLDERVEEGIALAAVDVEVAEGDEIDPLGAGGAGAWGTG